MGSWTNNLVFLDSKSYVDTHRVSPGGPVVSVEQFLVCHMRLSSYVLTCHLSFHPRLYKHQRVMLTPTGSAQGVVCWLLSRCCSCFLLASDHLHKFDPLFTRTKNDQFFIISHENLAFGISHSQISKWFYSSKLTFNKPSFS